MYFSNDFFYLIELPDLSEGRDWYIAHIATLKRAIKIMENWGDFLQEGIKLLKSHHLNYMEMGPQKLVILWWEW